MLATHLLTAALFLFTSVSALDQSIDEDAEGRYVRGSGNTGRKNKMSPNTDPKRHGQCVSNSGNGICVVIDQQRAKKVPCGFGRRKCTGYTRRPCFWTGGYADCT